MRSREEIVEQIGELERDLKAIERCYERGVFNLGEYARAIVDKKEQIRVLKYVLGEINWLEVICGD